jgi:hypothetical protein
MASTGRLYGSFSPETHTATTIHTSGALTNHIFSPETSDPGIEDQWWRRQAIQFRLHCKPGTALPFEDIQTTLGSELVYVHVVAGGKGVTLEDGREMFPSDTLVTQLRLLAK